MNNNYNTTELTIERKIKEVIFNDNIIKVDIINKYYVKNRNIVARIFSVKLNRFISNIIEHGQFDTLQKSILSEDFYALKEDLRWNLYLIFISDEVLLSAEKHSEVLRDDHYARKFILSEEELNEFISPNLSADDNSYDSSILNSWHKTLETVGLSGCLYSECTKEKVSKFIEQEKSISTVGRKLKRIDKLKKVEELNINKIKSVKLDNFRTHCFEKDKTFSLKRVNLLSGTNGSGKTSICDAIELALTGTDKKLQTNSEIIAYCFDGNSLQQISSNIDNDKKRLRDYNWYNSVVSGYNIPLKSHFESTNYFRANIVNNNDLASDINSFLERIIFGDEFDMRKNFITNYKKEFTRQKKSLNENKKEIKKEIKDIKVETINKVEEEQTIQLINVMGFRLQPISKDYNFDDYYKIKTLKHDVEILQNMLVFKPINSMCELVQLEKELASIRTEINSIQDQNNTLENSISDNRKELKSQQVELIIITDRLSNVNSVLELYKVHENDLNKISINKFLEQYKNNNIIVKALEAACKNFCVKYPIMPDIFVNFDRNSIESKIRYNEKNIRNIKQDIDKLSSFNDEFKSVVENLYSKFINSDIEHKSCPLCGYDYKNKESLQEAMNKSRKLDINVKKELEALYLKQKKHEDLNQELNNQLIKIEKTISFNKNIKEMIDKLEANGFIYESINKDTDSMYNFVVKTSKAIGDLSIKLNNTNQLYSNLTSLRDEGLDYIVNGFSSNNFSNYCSNIVTNLSNQKESINTNIIKIKKQIEDLNKGIKKVESVKLLNNNALLRKVLDTKNSLNNIYSIFKKEIIDLDFNSFIYNYNKSITNLDVIDEYKKTLKVNKEKLNYKEKMEIKLEEIDKSLSRCNLALKTFNQLENSDLILSNFVAENASYIEKIFKSIHQPKEFKDINIANGKITFKRSSSDEEIVNESEMSTGQCIALYTAVLLTLFNVSKNAPNIIIFDEPVANLDDLHLLSLIDIIREYVLQGVQVVFTTANPDIEKIFRRKFSFLQDDFQKIEFTRFDSNPTNIEICTYLPNKEECIVLES